MNEHMQLQWHNKDDEHIVAEGVLGKGIQRKMSAALRKKTRKLCIFKSDHVKKSIQRYMEAKSERSGAREKIQGIAYGAMFSASPSSSHMGHVIKCYASLSHRQSRESESGS